MPAKPLDTLTQYDFAAWRARCQLNQAEAATMLGVSTTKLWRAERDKVAPKELAWACYGIERYLAENANASRR